MTPELWFGLGAGLGMGAGVLAALAWWRRQPTVPLEQVLDEVRKGWERERALERGRRD